MTAGNDSVDIRAVFLAWKVPGKELEVLIANQHILVLVILH